MLHRENISYLVPRDPSIKSWSDRVKLPAPCTKNLIQFGTDDFEETMGDKIKVYLRLKPSVSPDNPYSVLSQNTLQTEAPKDSVSYKNATNGIGKLIQRFTFTSILDQNTTQGELFKKCTVKSIKNFLSGENYLLMAYGTTSAGKTYTMQGNIDQPGVIPRALDFVFTALKDNIIPICRYTPYQYNEFLALSEEQLKKDLVHKNFILSLDLTKYQRYPDASHITFQTNSSSGFSEFYENVTFKEMKSNLVDTESFQVESDFLQYSVWVSMIEIYNEQVYDLLDIPNEKGARPKLKFKDDEYGNTFIKDLRYVNVTSGHEAFQIFQFGRNNLHLAPTALNQTSSRSHCIFTITLARFLEYDRSSDATVNRFSFCDLAGIERAKKALNSKERLIESKAINTSLSILVNCLTAIKENQINKEKKMIPYRESKLTKLFRNAIIGKEQFSLIVNVTTEPNLFDETLNVLKFSAIAQKIVPEKVFPRPKKIRAVKRSRFARLVLDSLYNNNTVIDWEASAGVDADAKEGTSGVNSEQEGLQDMVEMLRDQLIQERKRCEQIESDLREELTSKFSEMLKTQNENHRIRLESETEGLREMYERKNKRIICYYEMLRKNKKFKLDDSNFQDEEDRFEELEREIDLLKSENSSMKEQVQELLGENNKLKTECSEWRFKLAEKDRTLEALQRAQKAKEEGGDALEAELMKQLAEAKATISHLKSLLDQAASDLSEMKENNKYLEDENESYQKESLTLTNKISELEEELKRQADIFKNAESKSKLSLENLQAKFEAVVNQNNVMKNLKDEAERQAGEVPQLYEKISKLEKEIENREKDLESFNENRKAIFLNYEKKQTKLIEEKERLQKDVLLANDIIVKMMAEVSRLKESIKKKDEEIKQPKAEVESNKQTEVGSSKKPEIESVKTQESEYVESIETYDGKTRLEFSDIKEKDLLSSLKKKNKEKEETVGVKKEKGERTPTPERLTKQIANLTIQHAEVKSTRKKVDLLEETIHPSTIKNTAKGKKKKENAKEHKEEKKIIEDDKENISVKKKGKFYKKLFTDNDFDSVIDLNASPLEKVSRLRPRK